MSILIKGMEMPMEGAERCIVIRSDGTIRTFVGAIIEGSKAIPVPTPHGRLIDASTKVTAKYYVDADEKEIEQRTTTLDEMLTGICELPPTIIEAEE